jgi:hypothetical protein
MISDLKGYYEILHSNDKIMIHHLTVYHIYFCKVLQFHSYSVLVAAMLPV